MLYNKNIIQLYGSIFLFFNRTRGIKSEIGCNSNFGLEWMPKLNKYSENTARIIFLQVINGNNWNNTDTIVAEGDSGDEVLYENGKITGCSREFSDDE